MYSRIEESKKTHTRGMSIEHNIFYKKSKKFENMASKYIFKF